MSQPLPTGGFKWTKVKPEEISKLAKLKNKGYILEVDVKYPKELHDSHNDLPFMCKKLKINGVEKLFLIYLIKRNTLSTLEPWIKL